MELIKSIIMGIVQGVAEFLPISSSGHLAIFKHILGIKDPSLLFDVMLHFGTLVAIFIAFWKDIKELIVEGFGIIGDFIINLFRFIKNIFSGKKIGYKKIVNSPYRRFVMLIIVSTIPTGIMGILFKDAIEQFSTTLLLPGIFLLCTGVILLIADNVKTGIKNEETAGYKEAGIIGIAQGVATLPGISRSGTTITACLLCGFKKEFAVKYSFIMSIPAVLGAVVLEIKDAFSMNIEGLQMVNYGVGTVISAVVGYICIKTMLVIVKGKKFKYFAYYCFLIGIIAVIANFVI